MGENSGSPGNFIQRYLTRQSFSPVQSNGRRSTTHPSSQFINSVEDDEDYQSFSSQSNRTPECQRILDRISIFCGKENLVQRVSFLDQELSVFGYPSIVSDLDNVSSQNHQQGGAIDLVTLVNISYDLLRTWRQSFETQNEANDLQRSSDAEIIRLRHLASRLKEDIAAKDRDLKSKELMQLQLSQRLESLKKKLKLEQEKSKRLTAEMTARDSQYRHDKKKKIQEIEKLQSRLQQLLQDKRQERMLGIEILNSLQRSDGKRGKWSTDKTKKNNEQDMYRLIITNYEDSQKQLLKENEGMRKYLKEMQDELISALNERNVSGAHDQSHSSMQGKVEGQTDGDKQPSSRSSSAASNLSENSDVSEPMSEGMFEMPFDLVKEDIERSIRGKWRALKKEIRKTRTASKPDLSNSNRESVAENDYDDLVQQQQELIDYLTTGQGENTERPIPEDCYFLEEKAELEKQKNLFKQQKHSFDKERQLYAEALIQLDDQRLNFETEKSKWLQQNFLQLTPFRNQRPSSSTHQSLRGKELSSHHSKSRQQPYRPRLSISPDRPALKTTDRSSNVSQSQPNMQKSPNNISHTLSRLHSSSHHNTSFSPDAHRSPDHAWPNHTPENKSRGQSNQRAKMLPPTTAELYRSLGLVYYGSDKENEISVNTGNNSSQVCPRSSGTINRHSMSHFSGVEDLETKSEQGSYKVKIQSKIYPKNGKQGSPSNSEYVSAVGSLESGGSDPKSESDYYDAQKMFFNKLTQKGQRNSPKVRGYDSEVKNGVENVPFMKNEFQISRKLPVPPSNFVSSVQNRKLFSSKSMDENTFEYEFENPQENHSKLKKNGIRSFVRNFIMGSPKQKQRDTNNNDIANSQLLSNSDSALSLHYALDNHDENEIRGFPYPSAEPRNKAMSDCDSKSEEYVQASDVISHQRTRSFPGSEMINTDCLKRRSYSYDAPILSAAAERHKSALLSISGSLEAVCLDPCKSGLNLSNSESNLRRTDSPLIENNVFNRKTGSTKSMVTTNGSINETCGFKFDDKQYNPDIYEDWSHESLRSTAAANSKQSVTSSNLKQTSQSGSSFQIPSQSGSCFQLSSPSGSSLQLSSQSGSSYKLPSQSESNYEPDETCHNQYGKFQPGLNCFKPVPVMQCSPSLLEQLVPAEQSYQEFGSDESSLKSVQ